MVFPAIALLLGACSAASSGPSLAPRPVESRGLAEPDRPVAPAAPADAALAEKIAAARADVARGQAAFAALLPQVETAAGAAGATGSESWIAAEQLLSALESARGPSPAGLAAIDTLLTTRLAAGETAGTVELEAARAEMLPVVEAQDATIARLERRISR